MSELQNAKTQLDKIREMRKELSRIANTLARMEMLAEHAIGKFHQNPLAQKGIGNDSTPRLATYKELVPLEGWVKSIVESYLAIVATIGIAELRSLAANLSGFVSDQRAKHESANTLRSSRVLGQTR